jgi:hypothetical protein
MRESIEELADIDQVPGDTKLRSLIVSLAAANWVTLMMILLVLGELISAEAAGQFAVVMSGVFIGIHLVVMRSPALARGALRVERVIHG